MFDSETMQQYAAGEDDVHESSWNVYRSTQDGSLCISVHGDWFSADGAIALASDILEVVGVQWTPLQ